MIDLPKPYITAPNLQGQVEQMRSYLFGLCEKLNYYLNNFNQGGTVIVNSSDEIKNAKALYASIKDLIVKDFVEEKTFNDYVLKTKETLDALETFKTSTMDRITERRTETVENISYSIRRWESGYTEIEGTRGIENLAGNVILRLPAGLAALNSWSVCTESLTQDLLVCFKSAEPESITIKVFDANSAEPVAAALKIRVTGIWKEAK